jgi:hypothetical protein
MEVASSKDDTSAVHETRGRGRNQIFMHVRKDRFSESMESRASQRNLSAASLTRAQILKTHAAGFTNVGRDRSPQSDLVVRGRTLPFRDLQPATHIDARASRQSSTFWGG